MTHRLQAADQSPLEPLLMPRGNDAFGVLPRLQKALAGGAPILPIPADDQVRAQLLCSSQRAGEPIDSDIALVACTSGSTGEPKGAMLSVENLAASADATHARLGGPGQWLLATPADHIAGIQVLARSLRAGFEPVILDIENGFDPSLLPQAVGTMTGPRRYLSLVPLQLGKALSDPDATAALAELDAVLVGGQATNPELLHAARAAGITVVTTYGSSETCGGVIYDGVPLDGVDVHFEQGRVIIAGPMVSRGYRNVDSDDLRDGVFRTSDAGEITAEGQVRILGRMDDVIISGGLKFLPGPIEDAISGMPEVESVVVVPLPDLRLGQSIAALITLPDAPFPTPPLPHTGPISAPLELAEAIHQRVTSSLETFAAPRTVVVTGALPTLASGKVDRQAAIRAISAATTPA